MTIIFPMSHPYTLHVFPLCELALGCLISRDNTTTSSMLLLVSWPVPRGEVVVVVVVVVVGGAVQVGRTFG